MRTLRVAVIALTLHSAGLASGGLWQTLPSRETSEATVRSGQASPAPRIFNGVPTGGYPAVGGIVIFTASTVGLCTGTLVSPSVLVTAAHCLDNGPLRVIAGFFPDGVTEYDYDAVSFAIEPSYSPSRLAFADIALLRLIAPVAGVSPMPLASVAPRPRRTGIILGFGQDAQGLIGMKEQGSVRLKRCPRTFPPAGLVRGQLRMSLCWHPKRRGQDTCHGDSGGPLVVDGAVAGVTSGGFPDCPGKLSWDTSVAPFRSWIDPLLQ